MNIFARFYFRAARLEREKCENKCSAKISTFTVPGTDMKISHRIIFGREYLLQEKQFFSCIICIISVFEIVIELFELIKLQSVGEDPLTNILN